VRFKTTPTLPHHCSSGLSPEVEFKYTFKCVTKPGKPCASCRGPEMKIEVAFREFAYSPGCDFVRSSPMGEEPSGKTCVMTPVLDMTLNYLLRHT